MLDFRPFGLRFVGTLSGATGPAQHMYVLPNGSTCPALAQGSPVKHAGGVVTSVGAAGDAPILGVATGFMWVNETTKAPQFSTWIPAGTSSGGFIEGTNRPIAFVIDDPHALFMIQANATVSQADVGRNFNVTADGGDPNTVTGQSRYALHVASRTSATTAALKVVGLAKLPGNAWDNPFPIVVVKLNRPLLTETSGY